MTKAASYYTIQKRPLSVTIMAWGVFLLGVANGWRAVGLGHQADLLLTLEASLNPWVGMGFSIFWGVVFILMAAALSQHQFWTRYTIPGLILLHGLYQLILVKTFAQTTASQNMWPALGLLFGLAFLFSIWALNRPSVRWYFVQT